MNKVYVLCCVVCLFFGCKKKIITENSIMEIIIVDNKKFDTISVKDPDKISYIINTFNESKKVDTKFANKYSMYLKSDSSDVYIAINGNCFRYKKKSYINDNDLSNTWK